MLELLHKSGLEGCIDFQKHKCAGDIGSPGAHPGNERDGEHCERGRLGKMDWWDGLDRERVYSLLMQILL
jgi:hypothetical protein